MEANRNKKTISKQLRGLRNPPLRSMILGV